MNIYTFEYFWSEFHRVNLIKKTGKDLCRQFWNSRFDISKKKDAIQNIRKTDKSAYDYLKIELNYYVI